MSYKLVTAATADPVSLAEMKTHLKVDLDTADENAYISALITAATEHCQAVTGRQFVTATYDYYLPEFSDVIEIPLPPLQSVTSVKYYDSTDEQLTLDSAFYEVITEDNIGKVVLNYGYSYPATYHRTHPVVIRFVAGYGAATAVPERVKQAIKFLVAQWYDHRANVTEVNVKELPFVVKALLAPLRVWGIK